MLSSAVFLLLFLPSAITASFCSNTLLNSTNSPYFFGSPTTTNNYNGTYNCIWTVEVPYKYYALLTTSSQLSSSDSVTIVYPGGSYSNQLNNAHPQNTFWLPEGESKIQFIAKSNGSLSFNLQWNQTTLPSSIHNIAIDPTYYPQGVSVKNLRNYPTIYRSTANSKSIALGVGGQLINNSTSNPHPLRSCFLFAGTDNNRTFITTLETIYPNVKLFGTVLSTFCVSNFVFNGFLVAQDGAGTTKYSQYSMAYSDTTNNTLTLMANGSDSVAVTVVTPSSDMHLDVTNMKLSDSTTTMVIIDGGVNNKIVQTFTQNNISLPFENHRFSTTFSVSNGSAQVSLHAHSNAPDAANCPSQRVLSSINSPYSFYNGNKPLSYWGPFTCGWTLVVDTASYAVLELDGNLGNLDSFLITYPGSSESRTIKTNDSSEKIYLPPGSSILWLSTNSKGTFQMKITWMKNAYKQVIDGVSSTSTYPTLFNISDLNDHIIDINSTDLYLVGIGLATLPINNSISYPFNSCFIMGKTFKSFQKTLYWAYRKMMYIDDSVLIYCVAPVNYTSGYMVVASSKILHSDQYTLGLLTTDQQSISLGSDSNFMTITQNSQMHTDVLNMTISSSSRGLTVSDGMFNNSVNYNQINSSYPIESNSQITIFSTTASRVDLIVQAHTKFVNKNAVILSILVVLLSAIF